MTFWKRILFGLPKSPSNKNLPCKGRHTKVKRCFRCKTLQRLRCFQKQSLSKTEGYPKPKVLEGRKDSLACKACANRRYPKRFTKLVQSLYLQKLCFCTRSFVSFVSFVWLASALQSFALYGE